MASRAVRPTYDRESKATFAKLDHRIGDQNLLSATPPCFGMHVKPLVTHSSFKMVDVQHAAGRKNKCRIFIITWWKTCCTDPTYMDKGRKMMNTSNNKSFETTKCLNIQIEPTYTRLKMLLKYYYGKVSTGGGIYLNYNFLSKLAKSNFRYFTCSNCFVLLQSAYK
jgi:hypothetical protein